MQYDSAVNVQVLYQCFDNPATKLFGNVVTALGNCLSLLWQCYHSVCQNAMRVLW